MKILLYSINYAPELTGIGKYNAEMAEWLAARGHQVSVVTAPPYYPQWQVHDGYHAGRYRRETRAGVDVRRAPLWLSLIHIFHRRCPARAGRGRRAVPAAFTPRSGRASAMKDVYKRQPQGRAPDIDAGAGFAAVAAGVVAVVDLSLIHI